MKKKWNKKLAPSHFPFSMKYKTFSSRLDTVLKKCVHNELWIGTWDYLYMYYWFPNKVMPNQRYSHIVYTSFIHTFVYSTNSYCHLPRSKPCATVSVFNCELRQSVSSVSFRVETLINLTRHQWTFFASGIYWTESIFKILLT